MDDTSKISVLAIVQEVAGGFSADNGLASLSIRAHESLEQEQLIELCSDAKTLFSLTTLATRSLDRVPDCRSLWSDTFETFKKAQVVWNDVPIGQEPLLRIYLMRLARLCDLSSSRVDLYTISGSDRQTFVKRHKTDSPKTHTAKQTVGPEGESDAEEERVKKCLTLPI